MMTQDNRPHISVIVCTHNRAHYLPGLFDSLRRQDYPESAFEIIVVDNASTDGTPSVVEKSKDQSNSPLRYYYEPVVGLNQARNTGARMAQGALVAYIDDDAIAQPDWLTCLARAYHALPEHVACVTGGIELVWEGRPRPAWLPPELEGYYSSSIRFGTEPRYLTAKEYPIGANMSIRRQAVLDLGGFSTALGRTGTCLLSNAEAGFRAKLQNAGLSCYYDPSARVYHRVGPNRTKRCWLLRRAYWQGVSDAVLRYETDRPPRLEILKGVLLNAVRALGETGQSAWLCVLGRRRQALIQLTNALARLGRLRKDVHLALSRRTAG